jgi:signal transduction histidine kinase
MTTSSSERKQTDEGLAGEREKTDHALSDKVIAIEERADAVVDEAREKADDVLEAARQRADARLREPVSTEDARVAVDAERAREDAILAAERALADEALRRARAASLARLIPFERDKTDLYLLTERARSDASVAHRDDFLGMVAHDLRNLLNGIFGNAAFLVADAQDGDRDEAWLKAARRIERAASRMNRLIGDLVDISSIDAGKLGLVRVMSDVESVLREATETWAATAQAKGIVLAWSPHGPLWCEIDPERILQIVGNLITNAVKFSPTGATVSIECVARDGRACVSVKDTGPGIPPEKLQAIFERFCQVGGNDHRGLGLGLYISRCLVEAHGGEIWAENGAAGGSAFFFTLPEARRLSAPPPAS